MSKRSAGILLYKHSAGELLVLLAHPGGPFWQKRDLGAWTIPKGEFDSGEAPENAARREFREELGIEGGDAATREPLETHELIDGHAASSSS